MIHFFPRFGRNAEDTPYGEAIRSFGVPHRIFGSDARQDYRHRWQLALLGYPRLAWSSLLGAFRSLYDAAAPDAVVVSSDVEALVFAMVRRLPFAARPAIVLMPFIFTERESGAANRTRLAYYRFVLGRVRLAICHSELEVARYQALFGRTGARFAFVRWGTHVPPPEMIRGASPALPPRPFVVSAGRSGRDYPALAAAAAALDCHTVIICNERTALLGVETSGRLLVLEHCFGLDYLRFVLEADVVAVPLRVDDISAGQMVLIQAMALGRPLVVTDTPTVRDYLADQETALLVPLGDEAALREAIGRLLADPALAGRLGAAAAQAYQARLGNTAHLRAVVDAILAAVPAHTS